MVIFYHKSCARPNAQREPRRFSGVGSTLLFGICFCHGTASSIVISATSALGPSFPVHCSAASISLKFRERNHVPLVSIYLCSKITKNLSAFSFVLLLGDKSSCAKPLKFMEPICSGDPAWLRWWW